jgi:hypothetical protein
MSKERNGFMELLKAFLSKKSFSFISEGKEEDLC